MFTLHIFVLLICLNAYTDTQVIQVVNSGLTRLRKNDMLVVFFVTVQHFGNKPRRAMVTMVECCEKVTEGDNDCDIIDLYGGDFGIIQPGALKNFTLIYPNLYGYNRRGYCLVNVLHRDLGHSDVSEIHHRIDFDTRLTTDSVPQALKGFYDPESFIPCETPDLDPLDHCHPVDCNLKYSGYRNFYNRKVKMCQRSPICLTDPDKELPDIVYTPNSNTCRDLEKSFTKEDFEQIIQGDLNSGNDQVVNIRCHHGEIDPRTGLCICDYGWKSEPFNPDLLNFGNSIYSMCTIKCQRQESYKYLPFLVGLILAIWLFFMVFLCEWSKLFHFHKSVRGSSSEKLYYPLKTTKNVCCGTHTAFSPNSSAIAELNYVTQLCLPAPSRFEKST